MLSDKEKIYIYESFLHLLQLNAEVVEDIEQTKKLISNACAWSYSHRVGNGEYSDEEQQEIVNNATLNLCNL